MESWKIVQLLFALTATTIVRRTEGCDIVHLADCVGTNEITCSNAQCMVNKITGCDPEVIESMVGPNGLDQLIPLRDTLCGSEDSCTVENLNNCYLIDNDQNDPVAFTCSTLECKIGITQECDPQVILALGQDSLGALQAQYQLTCQQTEGCDLQGIQNCFGTASTKTDADCSQMECMIDKVQGCSPSAIQTITGGEQDLEHLIAQKDLVCGTANCDVAAIQECSEGTVAPTCSAMECIIDKVSGCSPEIIGQMGGGLGSLEEIIAWKDAICSSTDGCNVQSFAECGQLASPCSQLECMVDNVQGCDPLVISSMGLGENFQLSDLIELKDRTCAQGGSGSEDSSDSEDSGEDQCDLAAMQECMEGVDVPTCSAMECMVDSISGCSPDTIGQMGEDLIAIKDAVCSNNDDCNIQGLFDCRESSTSPCGEMECFVENLSGCDESVLSNLMSGGGEDFTLSDLIDLRDTTCANGSSVENAGSDECNTEGVQECIAGTQGPTCPALECIVDKVQGCSPEEIQAMGAGPSNFEEIVAVKEAMCANSADCNIAGINDCGGSPCSRFECMVDNIAECEPEVIASLGIPNVQDLSDLVELTNTICVNATGGESEDGEGGPACDRQTVQRCFQGTEGPTCEAMECVYDAAKECSSQSIQAMGGPSSLEEIIALRDSLCGGEGGQECDSAAIQECIASAGANGPSCSALECLADAAQGCSSQMIQAMGGPSSLEELIALRDALCEGEGGQECDSAAIQQCVASASTDGPSCSALECLLDAAQGCSSQMIQVMGGPSSLEETIALRDIMCGNEGNETSVQCNGAGIQRCIQESVGPTCSALECVADAAQGCTPEDIQQTVPPGGPSSLEEIIALRDSTCGN